MEIFASLKLGFSHERSINFNFKITQKVMKNMKHNEDFHRLPVIVKLDLRSKYKSNWKKMKYGSAY